jgi:hypothetical protein
MALDKVAIIVGQPLAGAARVKLVGSGTLGVPPSVHG